MAVESQECPAFHLHFTFSLQSSSRFLGHSFPLCALRQEGLEAESTRIRLRGCEFLLCNSIGIFRILVAGSVLKGKAPEKLREGRVGNEDDSGGCR